MGILIRISLFTLGLSLGLLIDCAETNAQLILDFTRTETGGVQVTGTGSGTITAYRNSEIWSIENFNNDFLNDSLGTFAAINADSITGKY